MSTCLAGEGIRVAKPIRSSAGNYVESVMTELGLFHAVVFEGLAGKQLDLDELTPDQVLCWGKALGELHSASTQLSISWTTQLGRSSGVGL